MAGKIYPNAIKAGKVHVTFESEDKKKKAVILFNHDEKKDEILLEWIHPAREIIDKDRHEPYMFQALAYFGSFQPDK